MSLISFTSDPALFSFERCLITLNQLFPGLNTWNDIYASDIIDGFLVPVNT